jgi:multicomponent Na+:H+ antiporter subunit G
MMWSDLLSIAFVGTGAFFFAAGTAGLLRFPDVFTRLHAITKADKMGRGFVVFGLLVQAVALAAALKLIVIWLLTLMASSSSCYLIARSTLRRRPATTARGANG